MAEFSIEKYLADRISTTKTPEGAPPKIQDLVEASDRKTAALEQFAIDRDKARTDSWAGQLGLSTYDTSGQLINTAAQVAAGVNRVVGEIGSAPYTLYGAAQASNLDNKIKEAYARYRNQEATPEDVMLLSLPSGQLTQEVSPRDKASDEFIRKVRGEAALQDVKQARKTNLDRMRAADEAFKNASLVRESMNQDKIVDQRATYELRGDIAETYAQNSSLIDKGMERGGIGGYVDVASGVLGLIKGVGSNALNNKQAVVELIANNIPGLMMAAAGKGAAVISNIPYAVDAFGQAVENYQKKNNGALPPDEELAEMAGWAATAGAAEVVGDKLTLGIKAPVAKLADEAVETVSKVAGDAVTKGFKEALKKASGAVTKSTVGRVIGATGEAAVGEGFTEAYQTFAENQAKGEETSGAELYEAGSLGAMVGGGVRGSIAIPEELAVTGKATQGKVAEVASRAAEKGQQTSDAPSAPVNTDALLDPEKPSYDPVAGLTNILSKVGEEVPVEEKMAFVAQATKAVEALQTSKENTEAEFKLSDPEMIQEEINALEQKIVTTTDEELITKLTGVVEALKEEQQNVLNDPEAKTRQELYRLQLSKIERQLADSENILGQIRTSAEAQPTTVDIDSDIRILGESTDPKEVETSMDKVVSLAMSSASTVKPEALNVLADNPLNSLTPEQRSILRVISKAKAAEIALLSSEDVSARIYYGGGKDKGIQQYQKSIQDYLAQGNIAKAMKEVSQLSAFAKTHTSKAKAARQAWTQGKGTQILRTKDGRWFIPKIKQSKAIKELSKGLEINKEGLVEAFETEAEALRTAEIALRMLINSKSKKPITTEGNNVPNVPSEKEGRKQGQTQSKAVQENEGTGSNDQSPSGSERKQDSKAPTETLKLGEIRAEAADAAAVKSEVAKKSESTAATQETPSGVQSNEGNAADLKKKPRAAEKPVDDADKGTGLTILEDAKERATEYVGKTMGEIYSTMNRAVAWVTQRKSPEDLGAPTLEVLPLVDTRNFMSQWLGNRITPATFFPSDYELSEVEKDALIHFAKFYKKFAPVVKANFIKGGLPNSKGNTPSQIGLMRDPIQDFLKDGEADENMVTAVVYGAYSWLNQSVMSPPLKSEEDILRMHGLKEGEGKVIAGWARLNKLTATKDTAVNSMGQAVVQALGIQVGRDAPNTYSAALQAGFGGHAWKMLLDTGMIQEESISTLTLSEMIGGISPVVKSEDSKGNKIYESRTYVKIPVEKQAGSRRWIYSGIPGEIKQATTGSRQVLERLFESEATPKTASFTPVPFNQKKAKKVKQNIAQAQLDVLKKAQKVANYVHPEMWELVSALGEQGRELILRANGWDPRIEESPKKVQAGLFESIEAQNENLETQLDLAINLGREVEKSGKGLNQPLYHNLEVWKNYRVGVTTQDMNLQSSKIHRYMYFRKEWEEEMDLNNPDHIFAFEIAIAQAFGIKIDQMSYAKAIEKLNEKLNADDGKLLKIIRDLHTAKKSKKPLSPTTAYALAEFTRNEEGMSTLQAVVEYGNYLAAKEAGKNSVTIRLLVGADGKTNGPILSFLALGVAKDGKALVKELHKGGFYGLNDEDTNFNTWYARGGNLDLYQALMKAISKVWDPNAPGMRQLSVIAGDLVKGESVTKNGRTLVKTPLTSFAFGSSINKSIQNMQNAFIEQIYTQIQKLSDGKAEFTREELIDSINFFLPPDNRISRNATLDYLMALQLTRQDEIAIKKNFYNLLGKPVNEAMEITYSKFIERRNAVSSTAQLSFHIFNTVFNKEYSKEMSRLMDEGEVYSTKSTSTGERTPYHGMSQEQEAAVRKRVEQLYPIAHTAYSKQSDDISSGIYLAKKDRYEVDYGNFPVQIQFGTPLSTTGLGYTTSALSLRGEQSPGVSALPLLMHSSDSAVMHWSLEDTEALNVHDEVSTSFLKIIEAAKRINSQVFKVFVNYSPATEVFNTLEKQMKQVVAMFEAGEIDSSNLRSIAEAFFTSVPKDLRKELFYINDGETQVFAAVRGMELWYEMLKAEQYDAETVRLDALSELVSIDQYTWEGGQHTVTEDERDLARELLAKHKKKKKGLTEEEQAIFQVFRENISTMKPPSTNTNVEDETDPRPKLPKGTVTPFGLIGESPTASDPDMVRFFEKNPVTNAKTVIKGLRNKFQGQSFNLKLLAAVEKLVDPELPIRYVTSVTEAAEVMAVKPNARGWLAYNLKGKQETYVLSPEFKASGLTPELLLHELVHAALARKMKLMQQDPTKYADAMGLMFELEQLREEATKKDTQGQFKTQLENLDEFIAWGMTNPEFQAFLNTVEMKSSNWGNRLVKGMRVFIGNLYGLLFNRKDWTKEQVQVNGFATFIANVSGLLYQASEVNNSIDTDEVQSLAMSSLQSLSTTEIFTAIDDGKLDTSFQNQLTYLINRMENKLQGPFEAFKQLFKKNQALTPLDTWTKALAASEVPFASATQASSLGASNQEAMAVESIHAVMEAALDSGDSMASLAYKELGSLYMEAKRRLTPKDFYTGQDWTKATPAEQAEAEDKYKYVFGIQAGSGNRSTYLARFAALGLGHKQVNSLLKFSTTKEEKEANTLLEKLQKLFTEVLDFFSNWVNKTSNGQRADEKLEALMSKLVDIEAKRIQVLERRRNSGETLLDKAEETVSASFRKGIEAAMNADFLKNSKSGIVRGSSALVSTIAGNRVEFFMEASKDFRDYLFKNHTLGIAGSLLNEYKGPQKLFQTLLRWSKVLEGKRKQIITAASKLSLDMFENQGKDLKPEEKQAISYVMLRSGAHNLIDSMTTKDIQGLLEDPRKMNQAIKALEKELDAYGPLKDIYIELANGLGYYKATGENSIRFMYKNAHSIANLYDSPWEARAQRVDTKQAEETIKKLVSLYAMDYNTAKDKQNLLNVLKKENARDGDNGFDFILRFHKSLEKESLMRNFRNNPVLMEHGYLPEITNPHVEIKTIEAEDLDVHTMMGYKVIYKLNQEDVDPRKSEKYLVLLVEGGLSPYVTGSISYTSLQNKGSTLHSGFLSSKHPEGIENAQDTLGVTRAKFTKLMKDARGQGARRRDLRKERSKHYLIPLFNEQGNVVNYRYEMSAVDRDKYLQRDNRFEEMLGASAGAIFDKETSINQNTEVVKALKAQYEKDKNTKATSYVEIGPKSKEPRLVDIWARLPEETKEAVKQIWGGDTLYIRNDLVDIVFGQKAYSLREIFDKDPKERVWFERQFVNVIEWGFENWALYQGMSKEDAALYAKRAAIQVSKGERWWMDMVRMIKDIIVVKSVVVLMGNIWSNMSLLWLRGVPLKDMVKHHYVALRGARNHRMDTQALKRAEMLLNTGLYQDKKALEEEIIQLKDAIARNPVTKLVEEGLMPTIVDDVVMDEDIYSYKASMIKWVDSKTSKLPKIVKDVGKQVAMTHDTSAYQFLSRMTQLSDFVARYTLYQHEIQKKNPLSHTEAIQTASDAFINYDIPMHRGIQYLDNMGIIPFTKYFMRIQRVLIDLAKDHPMRVLTAFLLNQATDLGPIVLESSMVARLGNNPLRGGATEIFDVVDELPAVNAAMALIK